MKNNFVKFLTLVVAVVLFGSCATKQASVYKDAQEEIQVVADTMNKELPTMITDHLRLDKVEVFQGRVFKFVITVINFDARAGIKLSAPAKDVMMDIIASSSRVNEFIEKDITIRCVYYNEAGKVFFDVAIIPEDWKTYKYK